MRKFLLLTALLGTLCLWGCTGGTTPSVSSSDENTTVQTTTPATPSQSNPDVTTTGGLPMSENTDTTTTDAPATPAISETEKIPETPAPSTTTDTPTVPETTPTVTTTQKPATTTPKPTTTTEKPATTTAPTDPAPAKGTAVSIRYIVSNASAGSLTGATLQTIKYGETKTTTVTAKANLGYKFVGWSDGVTSATRSAESPKKDCIVTAIFEYDAMELPIISITTETGSDPTSKEVYIAGTISISNCDEEFVLENYEMQIRGRGNYTWTSDKVQKKSWRVKLSQKQNLLGQGNGKAKDWTLIANHCDQSLIRNYITLNYARKLEGIAFMSSATSVDVYVNGEYRGVYLLCEQNEVQKNRVNITENPESVNTGYLIEMTGYATDPKFSIYMTSGWFNFEIKSDLSELSTSTYNAQFAFAKDYINRCWSAVQSGNEAAIRALIDIDSVVDTYIVEELFKNLDAGWDSFYMYIDNGIEGDVLHFGPIWDFDLSGGNVNEGTGCDLYTGLRAGTNECNPWYGTLLEQIWFRKLVAARWNQLKGETDKIPADILAEGQAGFNAYSRNFEKWQIFGQQINREPAAIRALRTYTEHYQYYANWMQNRIDWLDNYFNGPTYSFDGTLSLKGSGTKSSPYLISSEADFLNFSLCIANGQNFAGKYFRQTADLDMTKVAGYTGLGKADGSFNGVYDGGGHTIRAVLSGSDQCIFPYLYGTIMNLFTEGSITNSSQASGICRSIRIGGVIVNCGSSMTLSGEYAGGMTASNEAGGGTIAGCVFIGSVSGQKAASPINCYANGRGGTYVGNYYLDGVTHTTADADPATPKNETATAKSAMATALNDGLSAAATAAGVSASDLCQWVTASGSPAMETK